MTVIAQQRPASTETAPQLHPATLGRYCDDGEQRELRAVHLPDGRRLVVDRCSDGRDDARLVGTLAADEPSENAAILARVYLADSSRGRCRALRAEDLHVGLPNSKEQDGAEPEKPLLGHDGASYTIEAIEIGESYRELRWMRHAGGEDASCPIPLRTMISRLQAYEPARSLTRRAIAWRGRERELSVYRLQDELRRVDSGTLVLNTRLREAVLRRVECGDSLSEIAMRCGRIKRSRDGSVSGETSWLMRRIGVRAEAGRAEATPWVHSDVLALIAREGLDLCPVDVEAS